MSARSPIAVVALALVVAVLGGRFAVRTLQTARLGDVRDFAILYTGAHLYRAGASFYDPEMDRVEGVNRNAALIEEARRLGTLHAHDGLVHIHAFSYPPLTVLPFVPFTWLTWRHAVAVWMALSLAFVVGAFVAIARAAGLSLVAALTIAAMFLAAEPLENSMALGQINQLVLALLAVFVWALASGREAVGGAALGIATALRFHPALFIGWLAWRRRWRACAAACVTALVCTALATATVGWAATVEYFTRVAPQYATVTGQLGNLSLTGWITATGHALLPASPLGAWRIVGTLVALATLAGAVVMLRPSGPVAATRLAPELGFVTLVLLLVTPNTTINHLVFTLLPLAVLVEAILRDGSPARAAWLGVAWVLIGAIDDYYQHPRLTAGPAVVVAGIKTYGLIILAGLMLPLLRRPAVASARRESIAPAAGEYAHGAPR